jgi:hypothetical protein
LLLDKLAAGANVATVPEYVTVPSTAAPPGPVTVNVVALIEAGAIASLKFALSTCPMGTLAAPFTGVVAMTVGAGVTVVKLHT